MSPQEVSVVIGFKDWGLSRLVLSVRSILDSDPDRDVEVLVSDYGSRDGGSVEEAALAAGARYVRTDTDGTWSRSRALNAGFAQAVGKTFISTDADMIFRPGTVGHVLDRLSYAPQETIILQCRDLPEGYSHDDIDLDHLDWDHIAGVAKVRPRWGMGGFLAQRREVFEVVRGYDARMHTYGGEDTDYALRVRRAGSRIHWFDHPAAAMFHMWHASSAVAAQLSPEAQAAVEHNRAIHRTDTTYARNTLQRFSQASPLCTFLIAGGPGREGLEAEIDSILGQTCHDIEILLHGIGPGPFALPQLEDARVRVVSTSTATLSDLMRETKGTFCVIHEPGTFHVPSRLESMLKHATEGMAAVVDGTCFADVRRPDAGGEIPLEPVTVGTAGVLGALLWRSSLLEGLLRTGRHNVDNNPLESLLASRARVATSEAVGRIRILTATSSASDTPRTSWPYGPILTQTDGSQPVPTWLSSSPPSASDEVVAFVNQFFAPKPVLTLLTGPAGMSADDLMGQLGAVSQDLTVVTSAVRTLEGTTLDSSAMIRGLDLRSYAALNERLAGGGGLLRFGVDYRSADEPCDHDTTLDALVARYTALYSPEHPRCGWLVVEGTTRRAITDQLIAVLEEVGSGAQVLPRELVADNRTRWVVLVGGLARRKSLQVLREARVELPPEIKLNLVFTQPVRWVSLTGSTEATKGT